MITEHNASNLVNVKREKRQGRQHAHLGGETGQAA